MGRVLSWLVGFGRFWYDFIIGDDWTVAAAIGLGLLVSWLLNSHAIPVWWLIPAIVVTMVGVSLRRASPTHRG